MNQIERISGNLNDEESGEMRILQSMEIRSL